MFNPQAVKRALPFSLSTADKLMKIAKNPVLADGYSEHVPNFPPNWRTLYELTKLPAQELAAGIESGRTPLHSAGARPLTSRRRWEIVSIVLDGSRAKTVCRTTQQGACLAQEGIAMMEVEVSPMVMEKAKSRLHALSKLAPKLNEATDRYMAELREIEASLGKMNLGISVELAMPIESGNFVVEQGFMDVNNRWVEGSVTRPYWLLGYGKSDKGDWRLIVSEYSESANEDQEPKLVKVTPLLEAPRDLRIAAADQIPRLLDEIEREVKEKIDVLEDVSDKG